MSIGILPFTLDDTHVDRLLFTNLDEALAQVSNPTTDDILQLTFDILYDMLDEPQTQDQASDLILKLDVIWAWIQARKQCGG